MRLRRARAVLGAALVTGGLVTGAAAAPPAPLVGEDDGLLVVASYPAHPARLGSLESGGSVTWTVVARLLDAARGDLVLRLSADGDLVHRHDGLTAHVETCASTSPPLDAGTPPACADGWQTVVATAPLTAVATTTDDRTWELPVLTPTTSVVLRVHLGLPATAGDVEGRSGEVGVGLYASGEDAVGDAGARNGRPGGASGVAADPLATTGASPLGPALLAVALVALGIAVLRTGRRPEVAS